MASRPAFVRRKSRWLIALALLPLWLLLAAAVAAYAYGLRARGLGWQDGPVLTQWRWLQDDGCVQAQGESLRITRWRPLTVDAPSMTLFACKPVAAVPTAPPWTPPFDLSIGALSAPGLPPMAVAIRQREQRWQARARHQRSEAVAVYDRMSGRWSAQGRIQAGDIAPGFVGALTFTGKGSWRGNRLDGAFRAQGRQLGHGKLARRTGATFEAGVAAGRWRLLATLDAPLALGDGWSLEASQALHASGDPGGVTALSLDLRAAGPQGSVRLSLDTEGTGVARGQGMLTLAGPGLAGTVPLRWNRQALDLLPATLTLPEGLSLSWPRPLALPLAPSGESSISAELRHGELRLKSVDSLLSWQQARWHWQGRLELTGRTAGHALSGAWQGRIDAAGPAGEPARLTVSGTDLLLSLHLPVAGLRAPHWPVHARFSGRYRGAPLSGTLSARHERGRWEGVVEGSVRSPLHSRGGTVSVSARWHGRETQWFLASGSRATVAEGLIGDVLLKPVVVSAVTPLRLTPTGASGTLRLDTDGAVAARWGLPAVTGQVAIAGRQGRARLRVPAWQTELALTATRVGSGRKTGAEGTLEIATPLSAAMSRGLGVTLQQGRLEGQGRWQWRDELRLQGDVSVSGLALDWGSIRASGGKGRVHIERRDDGLSLSSNGPVTLAELQVGTLLRDVRMTVQSDLSTWHFTDVQAGVLGGRLEAAALQWPSLRYQPVTISRIDLAEVAALQNDPEPTVRLAGRVGGVLPLRLTKDSLALQGGRLSHEGPLLLKVRPSAGVGAIKDSHHTAGLALNALSELAIHDLQARLDMSPDGWLDAAVTIKGQNPQQGSLPVILNYTHRENVLELLRSLRIGDEISRRIMERKPVDGSR
ncbi:intermembrane phospholipid transport protein YdbH family protein [Crenobacter luteus]|uniref:C4-dicarboxylate ABC transporter n=1 Tax=Crenobacter luteus TaxID=1452487 RepID=A0A165G4U8_9NEIS|nr:YdbH domain-containing protein [Crenobacter luteus]KZE35114.1 C4-dicarboxylate ABC transporter [Crenobacter luteus]